MAWTAHKDEEYMQENFDNSDTLDTKINNLVKLIKKSKHFVVFTGAGISTSAGIPDFRGPQGVWTLKAKGEKRKERTVDTIEAYPTDCHMALVELQNQGIMKYLISQNCDGLHRRSGIRPECISELHGNGNIEECEKCGKQYFRDYNAYRLGRGHDHFTGRYCADPRCMGRLLEYTIDFGQNLPEKPLRLGFENADKADLCLVLGSSLTVRPACNMPKKTKKNGGKLVICNLQKTPLADIADFNIYGKTDEVMKAVMDKLGLSLPTFKLRRKFKIGNIFQKDTNKWRWYIRGVDAENEDLPATIFSSVVIQNTKNKKKSIELEEEPFIKEFDQLENNKLSIELNFMGHYRELPYNIEYEIDFNKDKELVYYLTYEPIEQIWAIEDMVVSENPDDGVIVVKKAELYSKKLKTQDKPNPRIWCSSCSLNDNQILLSGGASDTDFPFFSIYDIKEASWKHLKGGLDNRWGHTTSVISKDSNKVYIFGGWDSRAQYNSMVIYNFETNQVDKIKTGGDRPSPRSCHSATVVDNKIYIFGGSCCKGGPYEFYNDVYIFDTEDNNWTKAECTGDAPSPRSQHSAVLVGNYIVVTGGYDSINGIHVLNDVYTLNLKTMRWRKRVCGGDAPRSYNVIRGKDFSVYPSVHTSTLLNDNGIVLVFGLCHFNDTSASIFTLDTNNWIWTKMGNNLPGLTCHTATSIADNQVLIFGGQINNSEEYSNDIYHININ